MITAHIKSPLGDRDEEWEDTKIPAQFQKFIIDFNAYVIGVQDDNQQEKLGIIDKFYWDLHEEVQRFKGLEGNYPGIVAFTRRLLKTIGNNFSAYLAIERPLLEGAAINLEQSQSLQKQLTDIDMTNRQTGEEIEVMVNALKAADFPEDPVAQSPELVIYDLLDSLHTFTFLLNDSIAAIGPMIEGVEARANGEAYSPLDYVKEMDVARQAQAKRQEHESVLTRTRNDFMNLFKIAAPEQ